MKLSIDTTNPERVTLSLNNDLKKINHIFQTDHNLSETLIPEIKKFLAKGKIKPAQLTQIATVTGPGHFSRHRTAVATVNALAYSLRLKQKAIKPVYNQPARITISKRKL